MYPAWMDRLRPKEPPLPPSRPTQGRDEDSFSIAPARCIFPTISQQIVAQTKPAIHPAKNVRRIVDAQVHSTDTDQAGHTQSHGDEVDLDLPLGHRTGQDGSQGQADDGG